MKNALRYSDSILDKVGLERVLREGVREMTFPVSQYSEIA